MSWLWVRSLCHLGQRPAAEPASAPQAFVDYMSVASSSPRGLTEIEAQRRLKAEGYNELPRADRRTPLRIVLEVLREPMLALLLGGGTIYLALGGSSHSANCRWPRRLQRSLKCEARCRRHMLFAPPVPGSPILAPPWAIAAVWNRPRDRMQTPPRRRTPSTRSPSPEVLYHHGIDAGPMRKQASVSNLRDLPENIHGRLRIDFHRNPHRLLWRTLRHRLVRPELA